MTELLWQQMMSQSALEVLAVICSLCYVHFAAKQHLACWPFALAGTGLSIYLFWETSLFFQSILNAWYLIMAVYGWLTWKKLDQTAKVVISWSIKSNLLIVFALTGLSILMYQLIVQFVSDKILFMDLAIAIFSGFVTYMLAQKVLENWLYWIVINALTAWLCLQQELMLFSVLFGIYVLYAVKGYISWRKDSGAMARA